MHGLHYGRPNLDATKLSIRCRRTNNSNKLSTFHFVRVAQHKRNIMLIKILTSQYIGSPLSNVMSKVCIYTARNIYVQGLTFGPFKTKLDAAPLKSHHITNLLFFL